MASHPCSRAACRPCQSGKMCADEARWRADEDRTEETAESHDRWLAGNWSRGPHRPPGSFFDVSDPYPVTRSGVLADDPALERG